MSQSDLPGLDFLNSPPQPVAVSIDPDPDDVLSQEVADGLLKLDSVVGAWIERDANGQRFVVLHCSGPGHPANFPAMVAGLPVRLVGGQPINASG